MIRDRHHKSIPRLDVLMNALFCQVYANEGLGDLGTCRLPDKHQMEFRWQFTVAQQEECGSWA